MKSQYKSKPISEGKFWRVCQQSPKTPYVVSTLSDEGALTTFLVVHVGSFTYSQTSVWNKAEDYYTTADKIYWKRTSNIYEGDVKQ